ncbi:MAG: MOSC domain-containing protein [Burkholderiales bacterium]|nr:MOSC domain-containing protein [Burkholderiales bacterium]
MEKMELSKVLTTLGAILCDPETGKATDSGFRRKLSIEAPVLIGFHGISATTPAAREEHKDADKAIHHYAYEHYDVWRALMPQHAELLAAPGAFSENFSTMGVTERTLCVGDIFKVGSALIQVTQGREACNTMVNRFQRVGMDQDMHRTARNGWFYRVLEEGSARVGDALVLRERPNPEWSIARVQDIIFQGVLNEKTLETASALPYLAHDWRKLLEQRIATGVAEKAATGRPYL